MSIDWIETGTFSPSTAVSAKPEHLHVVSWNIARGSRIDEIGEFLIEANADLILLQESDCNNRRTGYRNIAKELAQKLGMNYVFGIEFQELGQGSSSLPAYHGQATLSRWPLSEPQILRFRTQSKFWDPHWWIPPLAMFQRRIGGRMALVNRVAIGNRRLITYNLHLESRNGNELRFRQLAELLEDTRRDGLDAMVLAAGDFNSNITSGRERLALEDVGFENPFASLRVPTIVSGSFGRARAIDWVLIRGGITARSPQVHNSVRASDHYPLSLTLQFS
jgi:endonuclease/exonuclease/phosphatase family metal-dependent hydrolase